MARQVICDQCDRRKRENMADGWLHLEPIGPLTVRGFVVGTNDFCGIQCLLAFVVEKAGSLAANPPQAETQRQDEEEG